MTEVPAAPPVAKPDAPSMGATVALPLLHVPPPLLLKVVESPEHIAVEPVIVAGSGFTVTVTVLKQPVPTV